MLIHVIFRKGMPKLIVVALYSPEHAWSEYFVYHRDEFAELPWGAAEGTTFGELFLMEKYGKYGNNTGFLIIK